MSKNMKFHFNNSWLSKKYADISLNAKKVSEVLKLIGARRNHIVKLFRSSISDRHDTHMLIDATHIFSWSKELGFSGYFKYRDRYIWHYSHKVDSGVIHLFLDDRLRQQEQDDYLGVYTKGSYK